MTHPPPQRDGEQRFRRLLRLLKDADSSVRAGAANDLTAFGQVRATAPLITALADENARVRRVAARTLGLLKAHEAVDILIQRLGADEDKVVRRRAAWSLGELRDLRAIPALQAALTDPDAAVAVYVVQALDRFGEPGLVALAEGYKALDRRVRQRVVATARWMNDPHNFGFLSLALADDDWWIVWQAAQLLGRLGDPRAVPLLIARLDTEDSLAFAEITRALERFGDDRAVPPLVGILRSGATRKYARAAATLGYLGGSAFPALCALLHEPDPHLRWWALSGLRYIGAPAFDFVAEALHDADTEVRSHAIHVLADIDEARASVAIIPALHDPEPDVRWDAAQTLGRIGDERVVPALLVVAETDPGISSHDTPVPGVAAIAAAAIRTIRYQQARKNVRPDPA